PWEIYLVPRLEDGRVALLGKVHHSLVDGIAALQIVGLIVDEPDGDSPEGDTPQPRRRMSTARRQDPIAWAVDELNHAARAARGGTLNDIGPAVAAGALRELATRRGETPSQPLKAMVPVSMRDVGEDGPGNQISMVYIQLPVHLGTPIERLDAVRAEMHG